MVVADTGVGKTTNGRRVASKVARGQPTLGFPARAPQYVLYIDTEEDREFIPEGFAAIFGAPLNHEGRLRVATPDCNGEFYPDLDTLEATLEALGDTEDFHPDLVVIDMALDVFQMEDETLNNRAREKMDRLESIAKRFDCAVLAMFHPGKDGVRDGRNPVRGASAFCNRAVKIWVMKPVKSRTSTVQLECRKNRRGTNDREIPNVHVTQLDSGRERVDLAPATGGRADSKRLMISRAVVRTLTETRRPMTAFEIQQQLASSGDLETSRGSQSAEDEHRTRDRNRKTVQAALRQLQAENIVTSSGNAKGTKWSLVDGDTES